ncbi:periplasmic heavy metal sensor [Glycocaulis profundi]|nr:periplasmic heavy metal sensor [Glycocaulis profundi]
MAIRSTHVLVGALAASLLANGVLAGALAQRALTEPDAPAARERVMMHGGDVHPRAFIAALPEAEREAAGEAMRANMPRMRELFGEAREARRSVAETMSAEPFDPQAAAMALERVRAARGDIEAEGEGVLLAILAGLDPEARAEVLEETYLRQPRWRERRERRTRRDADN